MTNASAIHAPASQNRCSDTSSSILESSGSHATDRSVASGVTSRRRNSREARSLSSVSIGKAIAQRVATFDVTTIGVRYTPEKGGPTDEVIRFDEDNLHVALVQTDHLVLASPLTETTRRLIGAERSETLPPHTYLVNVGCGPIVDTDALVDALRSNAIGGAGLDVTDPESLPKTTHFGDPGT